MLIMKKFIASSGQPMDWKIECDQLHDENYNAFAHVIAGRFAFGYVIGVPRGGLKLASALGKYCNKNFTNVLIVDDVYTTGKSLEETRALFANKGDCHGVVMFARNPVHQSWITPVFSMWSKP